MKEAILAMFVTFLKAFDINISAKQLDLLATLLDGVMAAESHKTNARIKEALDPNSTTFGSGILAQLLGGAGISPSEATSIMETLAMQFGATGSLRAVTKKESNECFKVILNGLQLLLGDKWELSADFNAELPSAKRNYAVSLNKKWAKKEDDKKESKDTKETGYSDDCIRISQEWMNGELKTSKSKSILAFLPKNAPKDINEAQEIVKQALTKRSAKSRNAAE